MSDKTATRREFLGSSGALMGSAWVAFHLPAIRAAAAHARNALARGVTSFEVLTAEEAAELDAIAMQILPTDDTPGAHEAGVVHFMDRALGTFAYQLLSGIREGLEDLHGRIATHSAVARRFHDLDDDEQKTLLREIEKTPFFGGVRFLTVAGMFADPSYGGNRDRVGWTLIGFDGHFAHQPPFGYYDRAYAAGREGGPP